MDEVSKRKEGGWNFEFMRALNNNVFEPFTRYPEGT